jgi:hypothetical protein
MGTTNLAYFTQPFMGDMGTGGTIGLVPAPPAGSGAAGEFLSANGLWAIPSGVGGGVTSIGTFNSQAPSANGLFISGTILYAQAASATVPGMITTASQTFAGAKTFSTSISTVAFKLSTGASVGFVLTSDASGNAAWSATGSGVTTIGSLDGGTANANAASISGINLYLQSASITYAGVVNTTTQSFLGAKTFTTSISTPAFKLSTTPSIGNPLNSDAVGNAAWVPNFQLGTLDAFSRTQIWNYATSAILRLGSLASDGDPTTSSSEGFVSYGQDLQGDPMDSSNFGYARIKPMRFGLYNSKAAVAGYIFKVDPTSFYLTDDSYVPTFTVTRTTGVINAPSIVASRAIATDGSSNLIASSTTAIELGYVHGVTSSIQTQLNALAPINENANTIYSGPTTGVPALPTFRSLVYADMPAGITPAQTPTSNQYYYVSGSSGNDVTGDGTYNLPFATIAKAMSLITTANSANRFIIKIIGTKLQEPTDIILKSYVYIVGDQVDGTYVRINNGAGSIIPDPISIGTSAQGSRCGLANIDFGGGTSLKWDLFSIGPNIGTPSCVLVLDNVQISGSFTYKGRTPGIDFLEVFSCIIFGTTLIDACNNNAASSSFISATTLSATNGPSSSQYQSCFFDTGLTIGAAGTYANFEEFSGSQITGGNLTINDSASLITLKTDVASYPLHANVTITGTPSITFLNDAYALAYTPTTPANWAVVPTSAQQAFDYLASGGVKTVGALDAGTINANVLSIIGSAIYIQSASATEPGVVNTTTQSFLGAKTFTTSVSTPAFKLSTTPTAGYYMTSDASGNGSWTVLPTSVSIVGALDGGTINANVLSISGNTIYIQSASATEPGIINTSTQSLAGAKTFTTSVSTPAFQLSTSPVAGDILLSDASGNGTWSTLAAAFGVQTANTVYAGPVSGGAVVPAFRALVVADMPVSVVTPAYANEFHVNTTFVGTSTGSYNQPFITIQAAINAAQTAGIVNSVVIVHNSSTENITINNYTQNLMIQAAGTAVVDSQRIKLNGSVTISGTTTSFRMKDINVALPGGASPDLVDSSTGGRNYFDNVDFTGGGGIQYSGSWANWHEYTDCTINGPISIAGTPAAGSTITLWRTRGGGNFTLNASNASLLLYDSFNIGNVVHTAGVLLIDGGRNWTPGSTLSSTSNSGSDLFSVTNAVLETGPGTYAQINKTGTCFYVLSNLICNEASDVLIGTRLNQGATCRDEKYVPTTPANWSVVPSSVKQALDDLAAITISSVTTIGSLDGGTANANAASISGSILYLQSASVTYAGLVNITTQSFLGAKTFTTSVSTPAFKLSTTPTAGYYLTCDASGNGAWTALPSSITTVGALDGGTTNANVLSISGSNIYIQSASATQPGVINTTTQSFLGAKTFVTSVSTPAFKLSTSPTSGYIMTSDASGNASWTAPTTYSNGTVLSAGNVTGVANPTGGLSVGASGFAANTDGTTTQILSNNIHSVTSITEIPILTPTDITNGYIDVSYPIVGANSAQLGAKGLIQQIQGLDFSVSVNGGVSGVGRYTFLTALLPGGNQALVSGDQLILTYNRF